MTRQTPKTGVRDSEWRHLQQTLGPFRSSQPVSLSPDVELAQALESGDLPRFRLALAAGASLPLESLLNEDYPGFFGAALDAGIRPKHPRRLYRQLFAAAPFHEDAMLSMLLTHRIGLDGPDREAVLRVIWEGVAESREAFVRFGTAMAHLPPSPEASKALWTIAMERMGETDTGPLLRFLLSHKVAPYPDRVPPSLREGIWFLVGDAIRVVATDHDVHQLHRLLAWLDVPGDPRNVVRWMAKPSNAGDLWSHLLDCTPDFSAKVAHVLIERGIFPPEVHSGPGWAMQAALRSHPGLFSLLTSVPCQHVLFCQELVVLTLRKDLGNQSGLDTLASQMTVGMLAALERAGTDMAHPLDQRGNSLLHLCMGARKARVVDSEGLAFLEAMAEPLLLLQNANRKTPVDLLGKTSVRTMEGNRLDLKSHLERHRLEMLGRRVDKARGQTPASGRRQRL